jgi:hypothetical protein
VGALDPGRDRHGRAAERLRPRGSKRTTRTTTRAARPCTRSSSTCCARRCRRAQRGCSLISRPSIRTPRCKSQRARSTPRAALAVRSVSVLVPAEQVIDWQTTDDGKRLEWVIVMTQEQIRETPKARRGKPSVTRSCSGMPTRGRSMRSTSTTTTNRHRCRRSCCSRPDAARIRARADRAPRSARGSARDGQAPQPRARALQQAMRDVMGRVQSAVLGAL